MNTNSKSNKTITIDFLYLDTSICTRCQDTENSIEASLQQISELLNTLSYQVKLNKIHIETKAQAMKYQFISSPTIRVNNVDIQLDVQEIHCDTCSSLTDGAAVDCRVWEYQGKTYSAPPKGLIIDGILRLVYQNTNLISGDNLTYSLPENLEQYFDRQDKLCANVSKEGTTRSDGSPCCEPSCCS